MESFPKEEIKGIDEEFDLFFKDLAPKILAEDAEQQFSAVISDDTSGRLIGYFCYQLLRAKHPLSFVSAYGGSYDSVDWFELISETSKATYEADMYQWFKLLKEKGVVDGSKFIIGTEMIDTGGTIASICFLAKKVFPHAQFVAVTQHNIDDRSFMIPKDVKVIHSEYVPQASLHSFSGITRTDKLRNRFDIRAYSGMQGDFMRWQKRMRESAGKEEGEIKRHPTYDKKVRLAVAARKRIDEIIKNI